MIWELTRTFTSHHSAPFDPVFRPLTDGDGRSLFGGVGGWRSEGRSRSHASGPPTLEGRATSRFPRTGQRLSGPWCARRCRSCDALRRRGVRLRTWQASAARPGRRSPGPNAASGWPKAGPTVDLFEETRSARSAHSRLTHRPCRRLAQARLCRGSHLRSKWRPRRRRPPRRRSPANSPCRLASAPCPPRGWSPSCMPIRN
jgi:hypothetical protein